MNPYYFNFIKVEGIVRPGFSRANRRIFCSLEAGLLWAGVDRHPGTAPLKPTEGLNGPPVKFYVPRFYVPKFYATHVLRFLRFRNPDGCGFIQQIVPVR